MRNHGWLTGSTFILNIEGKLSDGLGGGYHNGWVGLCK